MTMVRPTARIVRRAAPTPNQNAASVVPGFMPRNLGGQSAAAIAGLRLPEYWEMFDTQVISAAAVAPAGAAVNFANVGASTPFFTTRTVGNSSQALTSMNNINYVDHPFKAYGIAVDVHCDLDAPTAVAGVATASAFVETVVNYGAIELKFGGDPKLIAPITDFPAGGGVNYGPRTDTRAAAANQISGGASNGLPGAYARSFLPKPILFKSGPQASFSVNLILTAGAVTRINALTALVSPFQALIRIKFLGYRGKSLLNGESEN